MDQNTKQRRIEPGALSGALLRQPMLSDSLFYFASKVVPGFVGLISVSIFIRLIGLDQYGHLAVVLPALMALAGASSGWLAQGILRFQSGNSSSQADSATFASAVRQASVLSLVVTAALLLVVLLGMRFALWSLIASVAYCSSLLLYTISLSELQAGLKPNVVLRCEIVRSLAGLLASVLLVLVTHHRGFEMVLLGQALGYALALLLRPRSDRTIRIKHASIKAIRELWHFGWAVGLWLLLSQLLPVIDRWCIQHSASFASAGIYASLYEVSVRSFSFLVFPLTQAAHPRIMQAWNRGQSQESYDIIRRTVLLQIAVFVALAIGVFAAARPITHLLLGFNDPVAVRMLPMLLLGGFLWQLALLVHKPLEIEQRTGAMLAAMVFAVLGNAACCYVLIPRFGYQVASLVLVFSALAYIAVTLGLTGMRPFRPVRVAEESY